MLCRFWRNRSNLFTSPYLPNRPALPMSYTKISQIGAIVSRNLWCQEDKGSPKKEKVQGFGVLTGESS